MTLNTSVVISFLFSEGIIVPTVRNRNEEKSSHFLSYFFRIQFHNTKYKKNWSQNLFWEYEIVPGSPSILGLCFSFCKKAFWTPLLKFHLLLLHIKVQRTNLMLPLMQLCWLPLGRDRLNRKGTNKYVNAYTKMIIRFLQKHNRTQQRG